MYCIFISDDEILLAIIKINKFNYKYWPRKSYFVIGISIKKSKDEEWRCTRIRIL